MPVGIKTKPREYEYQVIQDGVVVAAAWSLEKGKALCEAASYAALYAEDGPVTLILKPDKRKRKSHTAAQ